MKFEIGQKVETPLGVGEIKKIESWSDGHIQIVIHMKGVFATLLPRQLKPYKTPHERLLEMGYECEETIYSGKQYINTKEDETLPVKINIDKYNKYYILDNDGVNLKLSRILTDYLEELNEK